VIDVVRCSASTSDMSYDHSGHRSASSLFPVNLYSEDSWAANEYRVASRRPTARCVMGHGSQSPVAARSSEWVSQARGTSPECHACCRWRTAHGPHTVLQRGIEGIKRASRTAERLECNLLFNHRDTRCDLLAYMDGMVHSAGLPVASRKSLRRFAEGS
jgi:hypothetical protein